MGSKSYRGYWVVPPQIVIAGYAGTTRLDFSTAYRPQNEVEAGFRQMKDPHVVSFGPMHHRTDQKPGSTFSTASWP